METEDHDVILANGAAAETFVDAVTRQAFDNYAGYQTQFGNDRMIPEFAMPRIGSQRLLPDSLRTRLGIAPIDSKTGDAA